MIEGLPGWIDDVADEVGYPMAFVTVSGAHLYGFASVDSDVDLRAVHVLPAEEVVGLRTGPETLQCGGIREGVELDLVSHDLAKFARLLARPNGYVLEQLCSPLVVRTSELHGRLRDLVPGLVTRQHERHYQGFADGQWRLFSRTAQLKPALYTLRVLLSGIHLMRTGEVVADLRELWPGHDLPYVPELIAAKAAGEHRSFVDGPVSPERLGLDVSRLRAELAEAAEQSPLPAEPSAPSDLHDLLVDVRLGRWRG